MLLITGCASNKAEIIWQQDRETLQSQLKELGEGQAALAGQFQTLNKQLTELDTRMASHDEDQKMTLDQNEARFIELEKSIEALKKASAYKTRHAAVRKSKSRKKLKITKKPVITKIKNAPPPPKQPPAISGEEIKRIYINAYLALKSGRYEQAGTDFNNFLSKFPASKYTHQAEYWLGETLHAQGNTIQAVEAFQKAAGAPENNPQRNAALLRLGQLYAELGRTDEARTTFLRLIKEHPQSPEAETARKVLSES